MCMNKGRNLKNRPFSFFKILITGKKNFDSFETLGKISEFTINAMVSSCIVDEFYFVVREFYLCKRKEPYSLGSLVFIEKSILLSSRECHSADSSLIYLATLFKNRCLQTLTLSSGGFGEDVAFSK